MNRSWRGGDRLKSSEGEDDNGQISEERDQWYLKSFIMVLAQN